MLSLIPRITLSLFVLVAAPVQAQTLMVWGDNASSQISGAPDGKFKAIAAGGSINGLVLQWDGTPILWGGGPSQPRPSTSWRSRLAPDSSRSTYSHQKRNS